MTGAAAADSSGDAEADTVGLVAGLATVSVLLLLHAAPASNARPRIAQSLRTTTPPGRRMYPSENERLAARVGSHHWRGPHVGHYPALRDRSDLDARRNRPRRSRPVG